MSKNYFSQFKNYLLVLAAITFTGTCFSQITITYPTGNPQGLNEPRPYGANFGFERNQMIYDQGPSELNIPQGSIITDLGFYLSDTINPPSLDLEVKVYLREVLNSTITPSATAPLLGASQLVFSGYLTPLAWSGGSNWVTLPITSTFVTNGGSLEIIIESDWFTANGTCGWQTFNSILFSQHYKSSGVQYWNGCIVPTGLGTIICTRPNVQITYVPAPQCAGPPPSIIAVASTNNACLTPFYLSVIGVPPQSGLTFQWFVSTTSAAAGFSPIVGATNATVQVTQSVQTWYYCQTICGTSNNSTVVAVGQNNVANCYCASAAIDSTNSDIGQVNFASMSNGSCIPVFNNTNATGTYTDYTQTVPVPNIQQGISYPISLCQVTLGSSWSPSYINVLIDYNHDGAFDPVLERVFTAGPTSSTNASFSGVVKIPLNTAMGRTRMRVILVEGGNNLQSPCGTYIAGETEDYDVNILPGAPCFGTVIPGIAVSSATDVCCGETFTLSVDSNTTAKSGQTWQWQSSITGCGGSWSNIAGANAPTYIADQYDTTWYRCIITCSNGGSFGFTTCVQVNSKPPSLCTGIITHLTSLINSNIQTLSLQPNPASTKVQITYSLANQSIAELIVFDIAGKEMMRQKISKNTSNYNNTFLDISKLNNGFYTIRLNTYDAFTVKQLMVIH